MLYYETDYLAHHGVKGQKWGRRKQKIKKGVKKGFHRNVNYVRKQGRNVMQTSTGQSAKSKFHSIAERRAHDRHGNLKSTKRIAVEGVVSSTLISLGAYSVGEGLKANGHKTLGDVTEFVGTGAAALDTAFAVTSYVQAKRGRYK